MTRILIVGGVAGGASAAARARRLAEDAEIVVFERGPYASFANCGLPYYAGGEIEDRGKLLVAGEGRLQGWLDLDVRTGSEVVAIDRAAREIEVHDLATGRRQRERYDHLILAPGAAPLRPEGLLAGVGGDHPRVLSLRSLPDVDRIKALVDEGIASACVIGGGFIGLEMTEQLVRRGVPVSLVELLPQVMPPLDPEMVSPVHDTLARHGVSLHLGDGVESLEASDRSHVRVGLASGAHVDAELVLLAIGVVPDTALAREAGLALNARGAIVVDAHQRTSDPHIHAVGDAVEVAEPVLGSVQPGRRTQIPLAGPANRQGRLAVDHALSLDGTTGWDADTIRYPGSLGTSVVRAFDVTVAMTGLSEKALTRAGLERHRDYEVVVVHPRHHADYYPGAEQMTLKLLFALPGGRILGGQAVGGAGVDKRIDVIATALGMGGTVLDLEHAELCYAPQFGSAKDPVNLAAFQATNVLRGLTRPLAAGELAAWREEGRAVTVLDVRTDEEYAAGHLEAALHVPLHTLRKRLDEVPKGAPIVTYCAVGLRGYLAERILRQRGFPEVWNLSGGYRSWQQLAARGAPTDGPKPAVPGGTRG